MKKLLTRKQKEMLDYIKEYAEENGKAPTLKEMADHLGIHFTTAKERLEVLESKGAIRVLKNRWRGAVCYG